MSIKTQSFTVTSFKINESSEFTFNTHKQPLNNATDSLISNLHNQFNGKNGKVFFNFENSEQNTHNLLIDTAKENIAFDDIYEQVQKQINVELEKYFVAESGHIILSHYINVSTHHLYFGVFNNSKHFTLNEQNELAEAQYLDGSNYIISGRINLTDLSIDLGGKPAAIVSRSAGRKLRDFFSDCFGCDEVSNAKQSSKELVSAIMGFTQTGDEKLDLDERIEVKKLALEHCNEAVEMGQEVSISELSQVITPENNAFESFYISANPDAEQSISLDKNVMSQLVKYKGQGGGISISFDDKLLGDRIIYNAESDTLTIIGTPPNLREQLQRNASSLSPCISAENEQENRV